ncbi:hypothetical protein VTP01DRAFT_8781 [Rhizomucor pusillus]|uniref:uncharacterized protein n=1 Tax=Rhizomucor pusillus TaxID=4840 RepID=UPI0037435364
MSSSFRLPPLSTLFHDYPDPRPTLRIFRPVVLFHDYPSGPKEQIHVSEETSPLVQLKKRQVHQMLESNGRIWTSTDDEDDKTSFASSSRSTSPRPSSLSLPVTPSSQSAKSSYFPTVKDDEIDFTRQEPSHDLGYPVENRKRRGNLPKPVTAILKSWLVENCTNPYPTEEEKNWLKQETGLTLNQISNWFINARRRILPMILIKASAHLDKPLEHHRKRRGKPPSANRRTKQQTRRQCTVQQRGKRSAAAAELYDTDRVTKSTRRY